MGLRLKIFLPLVACVGLLAVYISLVWTPAFLGGEQEHHIERLQAHLGTLGDTLIEPLLKNDLAVVHSALDSVLAKNPPWKVLRLVDSQGKEIYRRKEAEPRGDPEGYFRITQPVRYLGRDLAVLELAADFSARAVEEANYVYGLGWTLLALLAGAVFVAGGVLELLVRRPVTRMVQAVGQLARGDFDAPLSLPPPGRDEIGQLVTGFTAMRSRLADDWQALEAEIAERKRAEEALLKETSLKELLQRATAAANEASDLDEAMRTCLDEICSLTGWPVGHAYITDTEAPGTLSSTHLWHLDEPERYQKFREVTEATVFSAGEGLPGRVYASGAPAWLVDVSGANPKDYPRAPVAGEAGIRAAFAFPVLIGQEVVAVLEFCTDEASEPDKALLDATTHISTQLGRVVERGRAEEVLIKQAQILDQIHDSVVSTDLEGFVTSWNKGAERLLGYTAKEALGRPISFAYPPEEHAFLENEVIAPLKEEGAHEVEVRMRRKTGEDFFAHLALSMLRDKGGNATGMIGYSMDITTRRRAEALSRRSNEELEQEVERRVLEVHEMNKKLLLEVAERKYAEEKIKASEVELRAILDSMQDTFYRTDPQGRLVRVSSSVKQLLGYSVEEILGKKMAGFYLHPEVREDFLGELKERGGAYLDHRAQLVRKDGGVIWVSTNAQFYYDAGGNILGVEGTTRDITSAMQAEAALRQSEERFSKVFHAASAAICVSTLDEGRFIDVNEAFLKLTGYRTQEVVGHTSEELGLWEEVDKRGVVVAKLREQGFLHEMEARFRVKSGQLRDVLASLERVEIDGVPCVLAVCQDLTELRRHEAKLKARTEALERTTAELVDQKFALDQHAIVAVTDRQGRITYANDKFCEISQYSREELLGQDHRIINAGFHPTSFFKEMWATIGRGRVWKGEVKNRKKDGSFYWVRATIVPFKDERGKPYQYVAIRTDITERKQVEEDLVQARDRALAASRLKSEFVANMSHEIRTPLNGVVGMAGLLMETKLDEEQHGYAGIMLDSAHHLTAIINNILDYSKITAGELGIEALDYDLRDLIKHLTRPLAEQARGKGLALTVSIAPDVPAMVRGDSTRLRQILTNLVANAVKFTERGEVEVNVGVVSDQCSVAGDYEAGVDGRPLEMLHGAESTAPGPKSLSTGHRPPATGLQLRFEVRDTGIGIAPDDRLRVFEAFRQVDGSTSRRYGGTGLGLAISRRLVEAMGGEIGLESRLGEGSLFWFTLPFDSRAAAQAAPTPAVADDPGRLPACRERGAHILVVEDNAVNQKVVVHMLGRLGCRADVAGNGRDALRALARADYDIVFMDCQMPELDGYETTRIIRQKEQANNGTGRVDSGRANRGSRLATHIPIIAMTAHAMEGSSEKCLASGMDDYLAKPLNLEVLRATLERWLPENGRVAGTG